MPGVEPHPEEGVADVAVDDPLQLTADLTDAQRHVPVGDCLEVRRDQPLDVVLRLGLELGRVLYDEARSTVEGAPDAERDREGITALDRSVPRAQQSEPRSLAGSEHQMAGQRRAVPREQAGTVALGHPRLEPGDHATYPVRRLTRRPLERGDLLDLVAHLQAVGRVDQDVGRVLDQTGRADRTSQLIDEERGHLDRVPRVVGLPSDDTDSAGGADPLVVQDRGQRCGDVTRLTRKAHVLEHHGPHRQRCGRRHARALVPDEHRRIT